MNITQESSSVAVLSIADVVKNEENFQTIANALKDAIILVDDIGKITFWNSAAQTILGTQVLKLWKKRSRASCP